MDEPEIARFVLGAVASTGQRTVGGFGWRKWLHAQLDPLADEQRAAELAEEGAAISPREAASEAIRRLPPV